MKKQIYEQSAQNARVDLNLFTGDAKFTYPTRKLNRRQEFRIVYATFVAIWFVMLFGFVIINSIVAPLQSVVPQPIVVANSSITSSITLSLTSAYALGYVFFLMFGVPAIPTLIMVKFKRSLMRFFPKINYIFLSMFCQTTFIASFTDIKRRVVEIPLFENIMLDYRASGEYSKYLKKIEINEHPFTTYRPSFFFGLLKRNKKTEANDLLWKATFRFTKVPKTGRLDVYFM